MRPLWFVLFAALVVSAQKPPAAAPPAAPTAPGSGAMGKGPAMPGGALGYAQQLAITGRLLLEDREVPPEPVQVDCLCRAKSFSAVTDAKGKFSIPVALQQVAQFDLGTAVPELADCRVLVRVPGFEDVDVKLKHTTKLSDLELGDITLKSTGPESDVLFSAVARKAPGKARSNYIHALVDIGLNKYDEAIASLDKAVKAFPQYSTAFELKGEVLEVVGQRDAARECYRQAVAADPGYGKPLVKLAEMAADDQNSEEAARWASMANRLAPGAFARMYLIEGSAYFNLGRLDEAGKAAQAGIDADRTDSVPMLHRLLGEVLYRQRKYAAARDQFNRYVSDAPEAPEIDDIKARAASCDRLAGIASK